jgi:hypothetical protein
MWPFSSYPERTARDVADQVFDYIVVGGKLAYILPVYPPRPHQNS